MSDDTDNFKVDESDININDEAKMIG